MSQGARRAFAAKHEQQEKKLMSDSHTDMQKHDQDKALTVPAADDGWNDAAAEAAERTIRGTLLKFADWKWYAGKEATEVEIGTKLVALATAAGWVRWEDNKPAEHRMRSSGHRLPDREELGYDNQDDWEAGPSGEPKDPWQNTRWVYLVDPQTAEAFTFTTSSWGGRGAVIDLGDQITRMRTVHPDAVPIVELRAAEMPTKFGRKSKPVFKVVGWRTASGGSEPAPVERQITAKQAKAEVDEREMNDEIPWK
jgi:hypothetical protein